jgi:YbbR domain-containing protein
MRALGSSLSLRLLHQWPLKVTAIFISAALWVYVLNQQNPVITRDFSLPVSAVNPPKHLELLALEPEKISVTLRGRASLLDRPIPSLQLRADLSAGQVGAQDVPVQVIGCPPGIEVVALSHDYVKVRLDLSVSARRPVIVETPGLPAEGYRAHPAKADPDSVSVIGPASMIQRVAKVVATLDISGLSASARQLVTVQPRDEVGLTVPRVRVQPEQVQVLVPIRPVDVKLLPIWPDLTDAAPGYRLEHLSVRPPSVVVSASPHVLRALQTVRTDLIDIRDLRGSGIFSVRLRVPNGVTILGPASAQVNITVARLAPGPAEPSRPAGSEGPREPDNTIQVIPQPSGPNPSPEGQSPENPSLQTPRSRSQRSTVSPSAKEP